MSNVKSKKLSRLRRATKTRHKIRELCVPRLSVHRTPQHIYAQILTETPAGSVVLASASSLEKGLEKTKGKKEIAAQIGALLAKRAKEKDISRVAFDRSGFKYHGRVKALADAAREAGLPI
ncbi:MAG: 50S ribosomal protein L18 [Gammaproteobacteria bacterium]